MNVDAATLLFTFDINLEYLGSSSDPNSGQTALGTTYVIDFQSFETGTPSFIGQIGNCQNRNPSDFISSDFNTFWEYSDYPYLNGLGTSNYLSYPPPNSDYWTIETPQNCTSLINYHGSFSWQDITKCKDGNNDALIAVDDGITNSDSITLSGTLYVSVVSPYSMNSADPGYYRVHSLIQKDFSVKLMKQINVLSSTGIDLFISSIIAIFEDQETGSFKLSVLTQSADYISLSANNVLSSPFASSSISEVTNGCLIASSYTCGQIFTITVNQSDIACNNGSGEANFEGTYTMRFNPSCNTSESVCNTFLADNNNAFITLPVTSNFIDTTCDPEIYTVILEGNTLFYDDAAFTTVHNASNGNYVIGQDPIYIETVITIPGDGSGENLDIFGVVIDNVFVCTTDPNNDLSANLNQQSGEGGCLSSNVDADGPYNIISNGNTQDYEAQKYANPASNIVRFSFLTFDIPRTTMFIHVQATLELSNGRRRRLLLQTTDGAATNQIRHFLTSTDISHQIVVDDTSTTTTSIIVVETENVNASNKDIIHFQVLIILFFLIFVFM